MVCGNRECYRAHQPAKRVTSQGTWMFLPHGQEGQPAQSSPKSRSAKRRLRRANLGGPPSSADSGFERDPEEETHTTDPIVDPSVLDDGSVQRASNFPSNARTPSMPHHRTPTVQRPAAMSNGATQQNQLLDALRQLVTSKKRDDDDWTSAAGPQKGVRWRGGAVPQPPVWRYEKDDLRAYAKYVKKVAIWKLQAAPFMSPQGDGPRLVQLLAG